MIGKVIKLNDYKLTYGQGTVFLNVFGAFKYKGNRYIIYSYDNSKLYWGSLFVRGKEAVVMTSKTDDNDIIKDFISTIIDNKKDNNYEIISLKEIESVQVIDEHLCNYNVDIIKLNDVTIPKVPEEVEDSNGKKSFSYMTLFFIIFILALGAFFFFNPEIILGKNITYVCSTNYNHDKLPASVNEEVTLVFDNKENVSSIDIKSDYVFTDTTYYKNFRDNSYFYQYFKNGDTYKFEDETYTYRLFSSIDVKGDYFGHTKMDELLSDYKNNNYKCVMTDEK